MESLKKGMKLSSNCDASAESCLSSAHQTVGTFPNESEATHKQTSNQPSITLLNRADIDM